MDLKNPYKKNWNFDDFTDEEMGSVLLSVQKRFFELSGLKLLNMNHPDVKRYVNASQKSKGFGGAN